MNPLSQAAALLSEQGLDAGGMLARSDIGLWGSAVTVGVSGGADSVGLALLAWLSGRRVVAIQVDHGLRPESPAEGPFVAAQLARFSIPVIQKRVRIEPGPNLEERARIARMAVLGDCATAHTLDDQAETLLANLFRGASLAGVAAMEAGRRHPVLRLRRTELRQLCSALSVEWIEDPSNLDPRFVRNRIRHEVIPLVNEITGRDVAPILARTAGMNREYLEAAGRLADEAREPLELPGVLLRMWLGSKIRECSGLRLSSYHLSGVEGVARGQLRAHNLPDSIVVRRRGDRLELSGPGMPAAWIDLNPGSEER